MAFDPVPASLKKLWDSWNLQGVVLFSLALQAFLVFFAPLRKRTGNVVIGSLTWSAYLLADWAAVFAFGLISSGRKDAGDKVTGDLLVFWAPFLLVHLGGPDTITAFALEDNALWFRHLVGLLFQAGAAVYIFLLTLPTNELLVPTVLMMAAGFTKYGERTRALYLASMDSPAALSDSDRREFKDNLLQNREKWIQITSGNVVDDVEQSCELVEAYGFFRIFRLLPDLPSQSEIFRCLSRETFARKNAEDVLKVLSVELNFFYEMLFTKSEAVQSKWGYFRRLLCFCCVIASLVLFIRVKDKHRFHPFDVTVTYALIGGAIVLDTVALIMLLLSDWTVAVMAMKKSKLTAKLNWFLKPFLRMLLARKEQRWHPVPGRDDKALATPLLSRRWSESIHGLSLLEFYTKDRQRRIPMPQTFCCTVISRILSSPFYMFRFPILDNLSKFFDKKVEWVMDKLGLNIQVRYVAKSPFVYKLWHQIVEELKKKFSLLDEAHDTEAARRICEARGNMALNDLLESEASMFLPYVENDYGQSIMIWHIATDICYYIDDEQDEQGNCSMSNEEREFSKILSDYLLYLWVVQQNIMIGLAGNGKSRFQETFWGIKFFQGGFRDVTERMRPACKRLIEDNMILDLPYGVYGKQISITSDALHLAMILRIKGNKWTIMSKVWMEMLCYAAIHSRADAHVQALSKGGELVTLVWLLMMHFGFGGHLQSTKDNGNIKLFQMK